MLRFKAGESNSEIWDQSEGAHNSSTYSWTTAFRSSLRLCDFAGTHFLTSSNSILTRVEEIKGVVPAKSQSRKEEKQEAELLCHAGYFFQSSQSSQRSWAFKT
jgi:hypothetical protein